MMNINDGSNANPWGGFSAPEGAGFLSQTGELIAMSYALESLIVLLLSTQDPLGLRLETMQGIVETLDSVNLEGVSEEGLQRFEVTRALISNALSKLAFEQIPVTTAVQ